MIPAFNAGEWVRDAARSARDALGSMDHVLIVDDGSTGRDSVRALDDLASEGYRVVRQANAGVSAARNVGLGLLTTPYAFALDADDLIEPGAPSIAADLLDADPEAVIAAGSGIGWGDGVSRQAVSPGPVTRESMRGWTMLATASCFRLRDWHTVGGFPEECSLGEDWVFWMRLLRSGGRVAVSEAVFVRHRIHDRQVTRGYLDPRQTTRSKNLVLTENRDLFEGHVGELIDELVQVRALLAEYRHAYRHVDRLKQRLRRAWGQP